jgi:hypothetical protein
MQGGATAPLTLNDGVGKDITIRELAEQVKSAVGTVVS